MYRNEIKPLKNQGIPPVVKVTLLKIPTLTQITNETAVKVRNKLFHLYPDDIGDGI